MLFMTDGITGLCDADAMMHGESEPSEEVMSSIPTRIPIEKIVDNTINDMENVKSDPSHSHAEVFKAWMIPDVSVKCIKSSS